MEASDSAFWRRDIHDISLSIPPSVLARVGESFKVKYSYTYLGMVWIGKDPGKQTNAPFHRRVSRYVHLVQNL